MLIPLMISNLDTQYILTTQIFNQPYFGGSSEPEN